MRRSRQINGVMTGKFRTFGGRWGSGKVHKYVYSKESRDWYIKCKGNVSGFNAYHGEQVDADEPVTCKKCEKL
jgi:hypothetical protein